MGAKQILLFDLKIRAAPPAAACLIAGAIILMSALAFAEDSGAKPRQDLGFFGNIGRWFEDQAANFNATFLQAGKRMQDFGDKAAKTTVDNAKSAADAVARLPGRVIVGHEKCANAPNGAPDCVAAATAICKAKGFAFGKSLDMTTAEICPPRALMRTGSNECHDETFVSRAVCQ